MQVSSRKKSSTQRQQKQPTLLNDRGAQLIQYLKISTVQLKCIEIRVHIDSTHYFKEVGEFGMQVHSETSSVYFKMNLSNNGTALTASHLHRHLLLPASIAAKRP